MQSSTNPKQVSAPAAEKLTSINPHLADGDIKEAEGNKSTMRPQQQEDSWLRMVTTRRNVKNKRLCLTLVRRRWRNPPHQTWRIMNNREFMMFKY
jgi:hypothetical protein